jgi:NAD(P)-dependent dehydrogenase (short-subunit alcohol dehydrogenase family)
MQAGLKGARALITGGTTGIGLGIAEALATEGVDIVVASRRRRLEALVSLRGLGVHAEWIQADVSSEEGVIRMMSDAQKTFGGLDLFVNNAAGTWHEPITHLSNASWSRTLATNLSACAFGCRQAAQLFIAQGHGAILIVGSTAAHVPLYRESAYRVSKAGLKALMEVVAIELAPYSIRVNLLTPGAFVTELTKDLSPRQMGGALIPLRRPGQVAELGAAAVLLLSDKLSSYTTGSELVVDGGFRLRPMELFSDEELSDLNRGLPTAGSKGT